MDRRSFVREAAVVLGAAPLVVAAQGARAIPRIGFLSPATTPLEKFFWEGMRQLGYVDGKNIRVESRLAHGEFERLPALAAELVRLDVDVIVAMVTQASLAAKQATATIPIVMVAVSDPVASKLVTNLARPEGNVTGTAGAGADAAAKQVELIHTLLPRATRLAVLWNPANAVFQRQLMTEARAAAVKLGLRFQPYEARAPHEIAAAFDAIGRDRADALLVLQDPMLVREAKPIADLALRHRIPAVSGTRAFATAGLVATYGYDIAESARRAAVYVDKILKGARPGDLPVELPTKFELIVNARTARTLGLTIPQPLLLRADEIVQSV
jgi:putative ABC transport system substrate-binding protein